MSINIVFDHIKIKKHFEHKEKEKFRNIFLSPKTISIFNYYKYIKNYGLSNSKDILNFTIFKLEKFEDYSKYNVLDNIVEEDELLEFEFPDDINEEDLFYFKMKFC